MLRQRRFAPPVAPRRLLYALEPWPNAQNTDPLRGHSDQLQTLGSVTVPGVFSFVGVGWCRVVSGWLPHRLPRGFGRLPHGLPHGAVIMFVMDSRIVLAANAGAVAKPVVNDVIGKLGF